MRALILVVAALGPCSGARESRPTPDGASVSDDATAAQEASTPLLSTPALHDSAVALSTSAPAASGTAATTLDVPGIGLTRSAWDRSHTRDDKFPNAYGPPIAPGIAKYITVLDDPGGAAGNKALAGLVVTEPTIFTYTVNFAAARLPDAELYAGAELSSDAKLLRSRTSAKCKDELYSSAALARVFGGKVVVDVSLYSDDDVFDSTHVTHIVLYMHAKGASGDC